MKSGKIIFLYVFSMTFLSAWSFTPEEKNMRAREAQIVLINKEYLDWNEYEVQKIFRNDGKRSEYPTPCSFSGNKDCSYTEEDVFVVGEEVSPCIYKLLSLYKEDTKHFIQIKYGSNLEGKPAVLLFISGSVKKPHFGYENQPNYYTTQYYRIYIP